MVKGIAKSDQVLGLIDSIYSAACAPDQWVPMVEDIQSVIGGHSVNFVVEDSHNTNFRFIYSNGVNRDDLTLYTQDIIDKDEFTAVLETNDVSKVILSQHIWDEESLHRHYPYEEFYEPLGFSYFNVSLFYHDDDKKGWLSVVRSIHDPKFTEDDLKLMKIITPHLNRAFLISNHLFECRVADKMCFDAFEHLSVGVIFLSDCGRLVHSNSKAQKYLRNINNMKQNFRVILPDHSANIALQKAIAETLYSNKFLLGRFIPFKENGERNMVICLPWKMNEQTYDWLNNQVGCLLFILSSDHTLVPQKKLMTAFNISQAESRVLSEIMNGLSTEQLADKLYVSETTVRFHIKNLLRKFASHNQIEMLSKVNRLLNVDID